MAERGHLDFAVALTSLARQDPHCQTPTLMINDGSTNIHVKVSICEHERY